MKGTSSFPAVEKFVVNGSLTIANNATLNVEKLTSAVVNGTLKANNQSKLPNAVTVNSENKKAVVIIETANSSWTKGNFAGTWHE